MNQAEKVARFAELHVKGAPLMLYNAWDAGSAKAIVEAGAKAIATSSWSVAEAQGYRDGEAIPIQFTEQIIARITATIEVPVTVDIEGGYSEDDGELADNVSRLLDLGVIGIAPPPPPCRQRLGPLRHRPAGAAGCRHSHGRGASMRGRGSSSSSTRGRICFWARAGMPHCRSLKLWTGPKHIQPRALPASSFPACETMR